MHNPFIIGKFEMTGFRSAWNLVFILETLWFSWTCCWMPGWYYALDPRPGQRSLPSQYQLCPCPDQTRSRTGHLPFLASEWKTAGVRVSGRSQHVNMECGEWTMRGGETGEWRRSRRAQLVTEWIEAVGGNSRQNVPGLEHKIVGTRTMDCSRCWGKLYASCYYNLCPFKIYFCENFCL